MRSLNNFFLLIFSFILCLSVSQTSASQTQVTFGEAIQLNESPLNSQNSFSVPLIVSPNEQQIVYRSVTSNTNTLQLFSVSSVGGKPIRLDVDSALDTGEVIDFQISPDSKYVLYTRFSSINFLGNDLYSVPIQGGKPIRLATNALDFEVSSDSQRVVYINQEDQFNPFSLISVSITGESSVLLSTSDTGFGFRNFSVFKISPDAKNVVFKNDEVPNGNFPLFRIPIEGGAITPLNLITSDDDQVVDFEIAPDSQLVFFTTETSFSNVDDNLSLHEVSLDGSPSRTIVNSFSNRINYSGFTSRARISSDGKYLIFVDNSNSLESLNISGPDVNTPRFIAFIGNTNDTILFPVSNFQISSDSKKVVFNTFSQFGLATNNNNGLFSSEISGVGSSTRLSPLREPTLIEVGGDDLIIEIGGGFITVPSVDANIDFTGIINFFISPDSKRVIYSADLNISNTVELFGTSIDGGEINQLSDTLPPNGNVFAGFFLNDDQIIYLADQDIDNVLELYSTTFNHVSGEAEKLNSEIPTGQTISLLSFFENQIIYSTGPSSLLLNNLFSIKVEKTEEFCFPITPTNGNVVTICL